jgi:uncharacterized protein (TIGR02646 family)
MKGSRKGEAPDELLEWLSKESEDWKPSYPFDSKVVRRAVISQLITEQRGLCVYCGRRLKLSRPGETFHLEHFWPQSDFPTKAVCYDNLFVSCGLKDTNNCPADTCGDRKANWFDNDHSIFPSYPACIQRFRFRLDGSVVPSSENDISAKNMISHLNLNHEELKKDRKDVLSLIDSGSVDVDDYWISDEEGADSYAHVAFYHLGRILP